MKWEDEVTARIKHVAPVAQSFDLEHYQEVL
jgi:hypothetical protein